MAASSANQCPPLQIFTSIRYDQKLLRCPQNSLIGGFSPFYMLSHHRDRLLEAAMCFCWRAAVERIVGDVGLLYVMHRMYEAVVQTQKEKLRAVPGITATVLFDYESAERISLLEPSINDPIVLTKGEQVTNMHVVKQGHWVGINSRGEQGMFPTEYVLLTKEGTGLMLNWKTSEGARIVGNLPLKLKVLLNQAGEMLVECSDTPPVEVANLFPAFLPPPKSAILTPNVERMMLEEKHDERTLGPPSQHLAWDVRVDTVTTSPSLFTAFKTTYRDIYNSARKRAGIESMTATEEVLLLDDSKNIMEGSLTTPYFWRCDEAGESRWITPPVRVSKAWTKESNPWGGQKGTTRRWLLNVGLCTELKVTAESLVEGEECWISNGVKGFMWGRVKL